MRKISLRNLSDPFRAFYQHGRWNDYAALLEEKGVLWLFEYQWEKIAQHVQPLNFLQAHCKWTERLCFLQLCSDLPISCADFSNYADYFVKNNDPVAAAATACTVVKRIFYSGNDFHLLSEWGERIDFLLRNYSHLPVCHASLLSSRATVVLFTEEDCSPVLQLTDQSNAVLFSKNIHSEVIFLQNALLRCFVLWHNGRFTHVEAVLKECEPLLNVSPAVAYLDMQFEVLKALCALQFSKKEEREAWNATEQNPLSPCWFLSPSSLRLLQEAEHSPPPYRAYPPSLTDHGDALTNAPTPRASENISTGRVFRNAFACFLRHYFFSVFYRATSQIPASLEHIQNALAYAGICQSPFISGLAVLLQAQSMAETGDADNAGALLRGMLQAQPIAGHVYLEACACLELASLYLHKADRENALHYYDLGMENGASGEDFLLLGRPKDFVAVLRDQLVPSRGQLRPWITGQSTSLRLTTLGEFSFSVAGQHLYDRIWRNAKAKTLLKALVAHGGTKVAQETLLDVLWPDADGDQAAASLKSTISRLRKTVSHFSQEASNWLMIAEGRCSLVSALCFVDAPRFEAAARNWYHEENDIDQLVAVLGMYTGDFLANDPDVHWIATPRNRLRNIFRQGVVRLARSCMRAGQPDLALNWLQRVEEVSVPSEQIFALQMEIFIQLGYPADALQVFREAKRFLHEELHAVPGNALLCLARKAGKHAPEKQG